MFFYTKDIINSVKGGLSLFVCSVLPALFPFLVLSNIFYKLDLNIYLANFLAPCMENLFKVNKNGAYAFITSLISGYPVGSKIVCEMYENKEINNKEANNLIKICASPGPIFVVGVVATSFLNYPLASLIILPSIYLATTLFAFLFFKKKDINKITVAKPFKSHYNIGKILSYSISNSLDTLLTILGYILFFSLIIKVTCISLTPILSLLPFKLSIFLTGMINGILEMTNGCEAISKISFLQAPSIVAILTFLLCFGGLCINMQCISFISKTDLNIKSFLIGRIIISVFAGAISFIISSVFLRKVIFTFYSFYNYPASLTINHLVFLIALYVFIITFIVYAVKNSHE